MLDRFIVVVVVVVLVTHAFLKDVEAAESESETIYLSPR